MAIDRGKYRRMFIEEAREGLRALGNHLVELEKLEVLPERVRHKMVLMHHEDNLDQNRDRVEAAGFRVAMPGQVYDLASGQRLS